MTDETKPKLSSGPCRKYRGSGPEGLIPNDTFNPRCGPTQRNRMQGHEDHHPTKSGPGRK